MRKSVVECASEHQNGVEEGVSGEEWVWWVSGVELGVGFRGEFQKEEDAANVHIQGNAGCWGAVTNSSREAGAYLYYVLHLPCVSIVAIDPVIPCTCEHDPRCPEAPAARWHHLSLGFIGEDGDMCGTHPLRHGAVQAVLPLNVEEVSALGKVDSGADGAGS
ncbi:hypothetical protein E2C01_000151 [Portunus trituberculatus]|uniref:Uncharacterized protein n=1 Tax=Portunus trituberculatus TaxID=210409 RepID=A0A5B7CED0_PORTR|nr:hypothetical protein [Portunus trituberculatus]